jgi:glycosyltransferase involved in cell wall biosynthesis
MEGSPKGFAYSVIIPAYNAEKTLGPCLEALASQTMAPEEYEVIVVDDGSTDGTGDVAAAYYVHCVYQPNQGPAAARNLGARHAGGKVILFTDSDCIPAPEWIAEMVHPFEDLEVVAVKGAYKTKQTELAARFAQMEFEDRYDLLTKSSSIDMIDTYSAAFRRDVFLAMGGFDQSFPVANNEDTDFSYRLAAAGCKMVFNPRAVVFHTHRSSLKQYLKMKFWRGYWRLIVYRRYPDKAMKDTYTPAVIKIQTLLMAISLPILFVSLFAPIFLIIVPVLWGTVAILALPFSIKAFRKDRMVGLLSPLIILLRSMVFAVGSLLGAVRSIAFPAAGQ